MVRIGIFYFLRLDYMHEKSVPSVPCHTKVTKVSNSENFAYMLMEERLEKPLKACNASALDEISFSGYV